MTYRYTPLVVSVVLLLYSKIYIITAIPNVYARKVLLLKRSWPIPGSKAIN